MTPLSPPSHLLVDDTIQLRLLRIMGPEQAAARPATEQFLTTIPEYRFAIHRRADGARAGRIHIRITQDQHIVHSVGHSGYAIDEPYRRNGYATRAVRLIVGLARYWGVLPLWVLIEPENIASRRTVERAGFNLIDIVDSSPEAVSLGSGSKICRYQIAE